jgi:hypothetical protein
VIVDVKSQLYKTLSLKTKLKVRQKIVRGLKQKYNHKFTIRQIKFEIGIDPAGEKLNEKTQAEGQSESEGPGSN